MRDEEAANAAKILGLDVRENLNMEDGFFNNDNAHRMTVLWAIRKYRPTIVLANAITDRHVDHGRASQLVSEACFYAGLAKIETADNGVPQESLAAPRGVPLYTWDRYLKPDLVVDITPYMDTKMAAIAAFSSQFYDPASTEPPTAISTPEFMEFVEGARHAVRARHQCFLCRRFYSRASAGGAEFIGSVVIYRPAFIIKSILLAMPNETENPWKTLNSTLVYDNPWIAVTHSKVITPGGAEGIYGSVHFKNLAIGIVTLDDGLNTMAGFGQFRYPLNRYSWEITEGGGKLGVDPLESAKRELLEETGLKATQWERILDMDLSNSVSDEVAIIYLARGLSQHEAQPEETEQLQLRKLPLARLLI